MTSSKSNFAVTAQSQQVVVLQVNLNYLISAQQVSICFLFFGNLIPRLPYSVGCMLLILGVYFVIGSEGPESWLLTEGRCPFWLLPLKLSLSKIVFLHGAIQCCLEGRKILPHISCECNNTSE